MMNIFIPLMAISIAWSQDFVFDKEKGRAVPSFIGQLKLVKGKVFKKTPEGLKEVETGERFRKSDGIVTEDKSFAKVQIVDDTVISVGPNTEMRFDNLDYREKDDRSATFTLLKGQISGDVKNKNKQPGEIKFRTTYTTMGIRGTYILMNHQKIRNAEVTEYALLSGSAEVVDHKNQKFDMQKGERIVIVTDKNGEQTDHEEKNLSDLLLKELTALGIDEEKEVRPFLPYFMPKDLEETSPLQKYFVTTSEDSPVRQAPDKREEKKPSWQENLQKLNDKLKQNQKKN